MRIENEVMYEMCFVRAQQSLLILKCDELVLG